MQQCFRKHTGKKACSSVTTKAGQLVFKMAEPKIAETLVSPIAGKHFCWERCISIQFSGLRSQQHPSGRVVRLKVRETPPPLHTIKPFSRAEQCCYQWSVMASHPLNIITVWVIWGMTQLRGWRGRSTIGEEEWRLNASYFLKVESLVAGHVVRTSLHGLISIKIKNTAILGMLNVAYKSSVKGSRK